MEGFARLSPDWGFKASRSRSAATSAASTQRGRGAFPGQCSCSLLLMRAKDTACSRGALGAWLPGGQGHVPSTGSSQGPLPPTSSSAHEVSIWSGSQHLRSHPSAKLTQRHQKTGKCSFMWAGCGRSAPALCSRPGWSRWPALGEAWVGSCGRPRAPCSWLLPSAATHVLHMLGCNSLFFFFFFPAQRRTARAQQAPCKPHGRRSLQAPKTSTQTSPQNVGQFGASTERCWGALAQLCPGALS